MTETRKTKRVERNMAAEWAAIERQANGPVAAPERTEVGAEGSGFLNPPTWPPAK